MSDQFANSNATDPIQFCPITRLGLRNFRSLDSVSVDLKPLTVVVGGNSAGKSSILAALRLLKQGQLSGERDHVLPLEGIEVELGQFEDLLRQGSDEDLVEISLDFRNILMSRQPRPAGFGINRLQMRGAADERQQLRAKVRLALGMSERSAGLAEIRELDIQVFSGDIETEYLSASQYRGTDQLPDPAGPVEIDSQILRDLVVLTQFNAQSLREQRRILQFGERSAEIPLHGTLSEVQTGREAVVYSKLATGGIPSNFLVKATRFEVLLASLDRLKNVDFERFYSSPGFRRRTSGQRIEYPDRSPLNVVEDLLSDQRMFRNVQRGTFSDIAEFLLLEFRSKERAEEALESLDKENLLAVAKAQSDVQWLQEVGVPITSLQDSNIPSLMRQLGLFLQRQLSHMGPLRQGPRRLYAFGERSTANDLGREAQYFAYFLRENRDSWVESFRSDSPGEQTLIEELSHWSKYLGIATSIEVREEPGYGRKIMVSLPGLNRAVDWEKVGVGVSQILPVLLKVLTAPVGSVTLVEQPELHLHPDAQAALADFLIAASTKGRNLIIETHSDALITRIRRRVTEEALIQKTNTARSITFIYASRDEKSGITTLQNVDLTESGGFADWPSGFADQSSREALELIQQQMRFAEAMRMKSDD